MSNIMKCKICKQNDLNEVIILRHNQFTKRGAKYSKADRCCLGCFSKLVMRGFYKVGTYWHDVCKTLYNLNK